MARFDRIATQCLTGIALLLASAVIRAEAQTLPGALPESASALAKGEWPAYAGTYAAARYSPLTQIDRGNARNLRVAWRCTAASPTGSAATTSAY